MLRCNAKHTKYLLVDEGFFSLNFGGSPFDWSLFTDTELNTSEPDLSLRTQKRERERERERERGERERERERRERERERERFNNTFIGTFLLHNSMQYDHQSDHILIVKKTKNNKSKLSQIKNKLIILQHT